MIFGIEKRNTSRLAAIDDSGDILSYGDLLDFSQAFIESVKKRTLIFILSENSIGSFAAYTASISNRIVPLILSNKIDRDLLKNLISLYKPEYLWIPDISGGEFNCEVIYSNYNYSLIRTGYKPNDLNDDLALLLPTSGSTGSPKLVRHSYSNITNNAKNVAKFFGLNNNERPIAILPMHYTMGLSVITSHLYAGATILLSKSALTDKSFWDYIKNNKATSFTGVPYSFEVLNRIRVFRMDLPYLRLFTQGGGKLREDLFKEFALFAKNTDRRFIATYGQTEGTARMSYLPAELAVTKTCSIGRAIPNGKLWLVDDHGNEINEKEAVGQLVYSGPNVTLGYADSGVDLIKGDENNGILYTGDIARRDADDCYYIVGRLKRFLKIFGYRIGLDELEEMIKVNLNLDSICQGDDEQLKIKIAEKNMVDRVKKIIVQKTGLFHMAVDIEVVDRIPRNEFGKVQY
jgi:long-chain acyl-CoA synthetase